MAKPIVTDELWKRIQHLFPAPPPRPKGGRKRVGYRRVLTDILFVLCTGIPWHQLPLGIWLRLGHDLLAPSARLAASGAVAARS